MFADLIKFALIFVGLVLAAGVVMILLGIALNRWPWPGAGKAERKG